MDRHGRNCVAYVGRPAVHPFFVTGKAVHPAPLPPGVTGGSGVKISAMRSHGKGEGCVAGPPLIGPLRLASGINPKLDLACVGLATGHTGVVADRQVETHAFFGVKLGDEIAQVIIQVFLSMGPQGDGEITGSQAHSRIRFYFDPAGVPVKHDGCSLAARWHRPECDAVGDAIVPIQGRIFRIVRQFPVGKECGAGLPGVGGGRQHQQAEVYPGETDHLQAQWFMVFSF